MNETLAARWAMKRITPKEILALENNLKVAEHEVRSGNPKAFVHRDAEFHEILAHASRSERLLELCQLLRKHMLRYRIESLYLPETALRAIQGHRRILEALKASTRAGLEKAIRDHLEQSKDRYSSLRIREKRRTRRHIEKRKCLKSSFTAEADREWSLRRRCLAWLFSERTCTRSATLYLGVSVRGAPVVSFLRVGKRKYSSNVRSRIPTS